MKIGPLVYQLDLLLWKPYFDGHLGGHLEFKKMLNVNSIYQPVSDSGACYSPETNERKTISAKSTYSVLASWHSLIGRRLDCYWHPFHK